MLDARDPEVLAEAREAVLAADAVCPHTDADGLSAGAIALRARGETADDAVLLEPGETPWGRQEHLAVLDQGVRPWPQGRGVVLDHHAPEAEDLGPDVLVVSAHGEDPEVSTAPLTKRVLPEGAVWLAALGAFGDLGPDGFKLPECQGAPKTAIRKLAPLVNAPRRVRGGPVRTALALLIEHQDARDALLDERIAVLEACKARWRASFDRAVRTAPAVGDEVAVVRFDEPCQVHPLVATTWQRRLKPRVVLAANDGWLPGRVNFAVRGGDRDLRAFLREALPEGKDHEFAHGHPQATGGSLPAPLFERLLERLGVPAASRG